METSQPKEIMKEMIYWKNKAGELALRILELENNQNYTGKPTKEFLPMPNPSIETSNVGVLDKSEETDTKQSTKSEILKDYDNS